MYTSEPFNPDLAALDQIRMRISQAASNAGLSEPESYAIVTAADEVATNIIEHAVPETPISCICNSDLERRCVIVEFHYTSHNSFRPQPPTIEQIHERVKCCKPGGLGSFLAHQLADTFEFSDDAGYHIVRLTKYGGDRKG